jgi:hypothetical protein
MADNDEFVGDRNRVSLDGPAEVILNDDDVFAVSTRAFEEQFDESILQIIDVEKWRLGGDVNAEFRRIAFEVREAARFETDNEKQIREQFFPRLAKLPNMPRNAGLHVARQDDIEAVHRGLLFNGGVEACDGIVQVHDTLPLTIYQIGVSLVSYQGAQGHYGERLFRHDFRQKGVDIDELIQFLERRDKRDSSMRPPGANRLGELVQKAILDYAERAILLRRSKAIWRMGHGNPVTYELLTGGNNLDLMVHATRLLRDMIETHQKFVFIASEPRDVLLHTFGQALRPMEYAIIGTLDDRLRTWLHQARFKIGVSTELAWDEERIRPAEWIPRFIERVASKVVVGLFRTTLMAPGQIFYAHEDHSEIAAHIAIADSMLREQGTPMLLEAANHLCNSVYGDSLAALVEQGYVAAGAHHRYFSGRSHRIN